MSSATTALIAEALIQQLPHSPSLPGTWWAPVEYLPANNTHQIKSIVTWILEEYHLNIIIIMAEAELKYY